MPSVCFYFQVHQPFRIKTFTHFDRYSVEDYFDDQKNKEIMLKVANKCYLPTNAILKELIERTDGRFRISFAITGVAIEQMQRYSPETLKSFQDLVKTGGVELIGETYHHSLAALFNKEEFTRQVKKHTELMEYFFDTTPTVFRNTELIYEDRIGHMASELGFKGILAEGADDIVDWRSPNFVYQVPGADCGLLLKNYRLSDDIAFRFSNPGWEEHPLTSDKFAAWVHDVSGNGDTVNLFMDYETFGEHQWESTGIFEFLRHLPEAILRHGDWNFKTPSEVLESYPRRAELHYHRLTSWADTERDITAWRGNSMQERALQTAYRFADKLYELDDPRLLEVWRKLLTSDHFYYMCTKWFADGDVHAYFSPFDNPYEAFIAYMNLLNHFEHELAEEEQRDPV